MLNIDIPLKIKNKYQIIGQFGSREKWLLAKNGDNRYVIECGNLRPGLEEAMREQLPQLAQLDLIGFPKIQEWDFSNDNFFIVRQYIDGKGISTWYQDVADDVFSGNLLCLDAYQRAVLTAVIQIAEILSVLHQLPVPYVVQNFYDYCLIKDESGQLWLYGLDQFVLPPGIEVIDNDIMGDHNVAPEIEMGISGLTPAADIYSLGLYLLGHLDLNYQTFSCARDIWGETEYWAYNDRFLSQLPYRLALFIRHMIDPCKSSRPAGNQVVAVLSDLLAKFSAEEIVSESPEQETASALMRLFLEDY